LSRLLLSQNPRQAFGTQNVANWKRYAQDWFFRFIILEHFPMTITFFNKYRKEIKIPFSFRVKNKYANTRHIEIAVINEIDANNSIQFDILEIANEQENALIDICNILNVPVIKNVKILIHNGTFIKNNKEIKQGGMAYSRYNFIEYNLINRKNNGKTYYGKHEMVHIVMGNYFGQCNNRLFSEGFATYLSGTYQGNNIETLYKTLIRNNYIFSLNVLINENDNIAEEIFYPISGIFIKWLINVFGLTNALKLYRIDLSNKSGKEKIKEYLEINYDQFCTLFDSFQNQSSA
jgi:hypothetical protein